MQITKSRKLIYSDIFQKCKNNKFYNLLGFNQTKIDLSDLKKAFILLNDNSKYNFRVVNLINDKISNNISWYDYLENIINIFSEINSDLTELEKSQSTEYYTPFYLIDKMLDKYPIEDFSNINLRWLDPCNGNGNFIFKLVQRLLKGLENHKNLESEDIRYKWILENMIYVCEIEPLSMFNYMLLIDPKCEFDIKTCWSSYLDIYFDYVKEEKWHLYDDTRIIGNPPFKNTASKLWFRFTNKSLLISNYVNFILPISFMRSNSKSMVEVREHIFPSENYFDSVSYTHLTLPTKRIV